MDGEMLLVFDCAPFDWIDFRKFLILIVENNEVLSELELKIVQEVDVRLSDTVGKSGGLRMEFETEDELLHFLIVGTDVFSDLCCGYGVVVCHHRGVGGWCRFDGVTVRSFRHGGWLVGTERTGLTRRNFSEI